MVFVENLPPELRQFLAMPPPRALLVKGDPGSGRSSLGLALAVAAPGRKIFVSTRVPEQDLRRQFPWLAGPAGRELDLVQDMLSANNHSSGLHLGSSRGMGELEPAHRTSSVHGPTARVLEALPEGLRSVLLSVSNHSPAAIVVDSLDAVLEQTQRALGRGLGRPMDRDGIAVELHRALSTLPAHIVLLSESASPSREDYLVDGLVTLREMTVEGQPLRELTVQKMRGVQRCRYRYPFTLDGGIFRVPTAWSPPPLTRMMVPEPEPASENHPGLDALWPGCRAFFDHFGALGSGQLTLVDLDPTLGVEVAETITYPMISHALSLGGSALFLPLPVTSPAEVWEVLRGSVPREALAERLRIVVGKVDTVQVNELAATMYPLAAAPTTLGVRAGAFSETLGDHPTVGLGRFLAAMARSRASGLSVCSLPGLVGLVSALGEDTPTPTGFPVGVRRTLLQRGIHTVVLGERGDPYYRSLLPIAHTEIRVCAHEDHVYAYGLRPRTLLLALSLGTGLSPYDLVRMA